MASIDLVSDKVVSVENIEIDVTIKNTAAVKVRTFDLIKIDILEN